MNFTRKQKVLAIRQAERMAVARRRAMEKGGNRLGDIGNRNAYFRTVRALHDMRADTASDRRWSYWVNASEASVK